MPDALQYGQLAITAIVVIMVLWLTRRIGQIFFLLKKNFDLTYEVGQKHLVNGFQQNQILRILEHELQLDAPLPVLRGFAASPDFLLLIFRHAQLTKPQYVVECSSGTSTVVLARCMQQHGAGKVLSLEHDSFFAEQTRDNLRRYGLEDWAEVIDAPLDAQPICGESWQWYSTQALPEVPIDMLVIDGPPFFVGDLARYPAGPILFPKLRSRATVFLDDADRDEEQKVIARWRQEFPGFGFREHHCEKGCMSATAP